MKTICLLAAALAISTAALAQTVDLTPCEKGDGRACTLAAIELHKAGKLDEAEKAAQKACELNDAEGCFYLGFKYQNAQNYKECNKYYAKACNANFAVGCLALANNIRLGVGTPPSLSAAMPYYQKACDLGEALGCSHVKNPGFEGHHHHQ